MYDHLHCHVRLVYERLGFDPARPPPTIAELLRRALGPDALRLMPSQHGRRPSPTARLVAVAGQWEVRLDVGLQYEAWTVALGDALARWYMATWLPKNVRLDAREVERLGWRLILPEATFRSLVLVGYGAEDIAASVCVPVETIRVRLREMDAAARRSRIEQSGLRVARARPEAPDAAASETRIRVGARVRDAG